MARAKKQKIESTPQHYSGLDAVLEAGSSQQLSGTDVLRLTICWAAAAAQPQQPARSKSKGGGGGAAGLTDAAASPSAALAVLDASLHSFGTSDASPVQSPDVAAIRGTPGGSHDKWGGGFGGSSPKKDEGLATTTTNNGQDEEGSNEILDHVSVARPFVKYMAHHRRKHILQFEQQQHHQGQNDDLLVPPPPPQPHADGFYRGDTFELDLAEAPHDTEGFLLSAVLYNKDIFLSDLQNLHVRVESVHSSSGTAPSPVCTLALQANVLCNSATHFPGSASLILLMIRKRLATNVPATPGSTHSSPSSPRGGKVGGGRGAAAPPPAVRSGCYYWELVCLDELQENREIGALQDIVRRRGLVDGDVYCGIPTVLPHPLIDPGQAIMVNRSRRGSEAISTDDDADTADFVPLMFQSSNHSGNGPTSPTHAIVGDGGMFLLDGRNNSLCGAAAAPSPAPHHHHRKNNAAVAQLLTTVPRVVREERRRYNVGRPVSVSDPLNDGGSSDDEQHAIVASMKAVAPLYDAPRTVRFGTNTYNVGSEIGKLKRHLVEHRVDYEQVIDPPSPPRGGAGHIEPIWRIGAAAASNNNTAAAPATTTTTSSAVISPANHPTSSNGLGLSTSGRLGGNIPLTPNHSPLQVQQKSGANISPSSSTAAAVVNRELEEEADLLLTSPLKPNLPREMAQMLEQQQRHQRALSSSWQTQHTNNSQGRNNGGMGRSPNATSFAGGGGRNRRQSVAAGNKSMRRATSAVSSPVPPPGVDAHAPTPFRNGDMARVGGGGNAHGGAARLDSRGSIRGGPNTPQTTTRTTSRSGAGGGRTGSGFGGGGRFPDVGVNTRRVSAAGGGGGRQNAFDGLTPSILVSPDAAGGRIPKHYFPDNSNNDTAAGRNHGGTVRSGSGDSSSYRHHGNNRHSSFDDDGRQHTDMPFPAPPAYNNTMNGSGRSGQHSGGGGGYHRATSPTSPTSYTQTFQTHPTGTTSPTHHGQHQQGRGKDGSGIPRRPLSQSGNNEAPNGSRQQDQFQQDQRYHHGHNGAAPPSSAPAGLSHRTSPRTSPRETSLVSIRDPNSDGYDPNHGSNKYQQHGQHHHQHAQLSRDVVASLALPPPGGKPPFVPNNNGGGGGHNDYYSLQHRTSGSGGDQHRTKSPFYSGGSGNNGGGIGGLLPNMFNTANRKVVPSGSLSLSLSSHLPYYGLKGVATTISTANRIKMATERSRRRRQRHSSLRSEQAQVLGSLQQMLSGLLPMLNLQHPQQSSPIRRPSQQTSTTPQRDPTTSSSTPPKATTMLIPKPPSAARTSTTSKDNSSSAHRGSGGGHE